MVISCKTPRQTQNRVQLNTWTSIDPFKLTRKINHHIWRIYSWWIHMGCGKSMVTTKDEQKKVTCNYKNIFVSHYWDSKGFVLSYNDVCMVPKRVLLSWGTHRNFYELSFLGRITILTFIFPTQADLYFYKISSISNAILLFYHPSNNSVSVFEITLQTDFFHHGQWKCFNYHCQRKRPLPLPSWSFPGKKECLN